MQIAKIINSHSHIEYLARVLDTLDVRVPPQPSDYAFGRFVQMECEQQQIIGIIADSQLFNPEYGHLGPRLTPTPEDNRLFSPDYLHEQGVLISILLLGWLARNEADEYYGMHRVPAYVLSVQTPVVLLDEKTELAFHRGINGRLQMGYYNTIMAMGNGRSVSLIQVIIERLMAKVAPGEQAQLTLLQRNLSWQQTLGGMRRR